MTRAAYGIDIDQLRVEVIRPVLTYLGLHSVAAEQLVLGTALTESLAGYIKQLGNGPALGLWQMEPATHDDIFNNYLAFHSDLREKVTDFATRSLVTCGARELIGNLFYGAAMCRVHYRRVREALPAAGDTHGLAQYWKTYYNTALGAGDVQHALQHFEVACGYARRG